MKTLSYLSLILLLNFITAKAQFKKPKFGDVELSDLTMKNYSKDTSAGALILFDNGLTFFRLDPDRKFRYTHERHCRIKIFNKSAFDLADFRIRLYKNRTSEEKLIELKAITYNFFEGKIVKTKFDTDKSYLAEGKNYNDKKFALPDVKEGSIIEFAYTISSDFLYNLRSWKFQSLYPAVWSQYKYSIPEYFEYRQASKGYLPFTVYKQEEVSTTYHMHEDSSPGNGLGATRSVAENYSLQAILKETVLAIKDVPAFVTEPGLDCEENYIQTIDFELSSIQFPNQSREDYTQSWETINSDLNKDESFGALMKSDAFIKDTVFKLCEKVVSELEKATIIYNFIQKRMKWDNSFSIWSTEGLKSAFNKRIGNSSEINLLLTLMLRTAGLNADPVIFSTRDNGTAASYNPTISKFNSVLTVLEIDKKRILLDARNKFCPFGVIPSNDINGTGRVINNTNGSWVDLECAEKYKEVIGYALDISSEGEFNGRIIANYYGYAALSFRNSVDIEKSESNFVKKIQENNTGLIISKYSISNLQHINRPVIDTMYVKIENQIDLIADKILFKPLLYEVVEKNKYTLQERKYPVKYNYPISEMYIYEYTLPAGYEVESIPQSVLLKLPDNSMSVMYSIQIIENKIKINYKRTVTKTTYLPEEYADLKAFYDQVVKKNAEQIILKKIN